MFKNGKLFGKINVIDFLVVVVILVAVIAVAAFVFMPKDGADTLVMKFRIEEVDEFVALKVKVGDPLYDDTYSLDLGKVTDIEIDDSISYGSLMDGTFSLTSKEDYCSMIITGEVKGTKTKLGAEIGGKKYGVGHTFVLRAGDAKLYLRVYDIKVKDADEEDNAANEDNENSVNVELTLFTAEAANFITDNITVGEEAYQSGKNALIGTVKSVEKGPAQIYVETEDGLILSSKEGYSSVTIKCIAKADVKENGIFVDKQRVLAGKELDVIVGNAMFEAVISDVAVIESDDEKAVVEQ